MILCIYSRLDGPVGSRLGIGDDNDNRMALFMPQVAEYGLLPDPKLLMSCECYRTHTSGVERFSRLKPKNKSVKYVA